MELTRPAASAEAAAPQPSNSVGLFMCPSLYRAVYGGQMEEVMKRLLQRQHCAAGVTGIQHEQCDIHEVSAGRNTVLHVAAEQGHDELMRELYFRFRDNNLLSSLNSTLDTPLHCAARAGRDRAVSQLVQLAQDCGESILDCKNEAGDTALHLAARQGHGAAVEALVWAAPELASELNNAGMSPLYLAVMSTSVHAVRAITMCRDASSVGPSSQNALHAAVFQSSEIVDLLLQWNPSLAAEVDCNGSSPLHFASSDGDLSIVSAILDAAPPNTVYMKDSDGLSALHVAALMDHHRVVNKLLTDCPDAAELRDDHGWTFLHAAAKEKRSSVVSLAINNPMLLGGLLNAQDRDGNTPLHLAVVAGASGVAEALVSKGKVRADVMNNDGNTPLDLAAKSTSLFTVVSLVVTLVAFGAQSRPQRQDHIKQWSGRDIAQGIEKTSESLTVVAVLISTVAFSAVFNVPGGTDDNGKPHLMEKRVFKCFLLLDAVALATSVVAVILLVYGKASRSAGSWKSFVASLHFLWVSLISMMLAFYAAVIALVATASTGTVICVYLAIYMCIIVLIFSINKWIAPAASSRTIWRFFWRSRLKGRRMRIRRQYPFAGASVPNLHLFSVINVLAILVIIIVLPALRGIDDVIPSRQDGSVPAPSPS